MKEYATINKVAGPLIFVEKTDPIGYGELVQITAGEKTKLGQVLDTSDDLVVVQVFETTTGIDKGTHVKFLGDVVKLDVSKDIIGRIFNGRGKPIDGGPPLLAEKRVPIIGQAINPYSRGPPANCIQTGISTIDLTNTLVRGQKLPIFSGSGLPHNKLALQITRQATVLGKNESFAVVFAGIGITNEEAQAFMQEFEETGALAKSVVFLNTSADPAVERVLTPKMALTAAEYLAFERDMHVLVIMTDITNYCEALREIGAAREEIPGRRGYPGYMYTDLASMYERAGMIKGRKGSITQIPILTMIGDDITHPIPDLTGYITEGQIVLTKELHRKGVYPPIDVLPSLSRLMNNGIGEKKTRVDHRGVADQLFASYAKGRDLRQLVAIIGEDALSSEDKQALQFAQAFEDTFVNQQHANRTVVNSFDTAWELLSTFPEEALKRIKPEFVKEYYHGTDQTNEERAPEDEEADQASEDGA
ncbi:MAG: V-type ATP synthase subunit B [Candidatus Woesearchaeota archaeon]|nr:V-type ATP synthase subunit B [Candidatus Woesearchaeota archaeon]